MNKTALEKLIIWPLLVFFLITGSRFLRQGKKGIEIEETTEGISLPIPKDKNLPQGVETEIYNKSLVSEMDIQYQGAESRDPFSSPIAKKRVLSIHEAGRDEEIPHLSLNGIVWNVDKPIAIINNKIVRKGDNIEGVEITGITREGVNLRFKTKQFMLKPRHLEGKEGEAH